MDTKTKIKDAKPLPLPQEIIEKIRQPIPLEATKEVSLGSRKYTAIKAYYIIERLNSIFGIHGWSHTCEVVFINDKEAAVKGRLSLWDYGIIIEEMGGHNDKDAGNRVKGAKTSSLSKCTSILGMGHEIYAQSYSKGNTNPKKARTIKPPSPTQKPAPKKDKKTFKVSTKENLEKVLEKVIQDNDGTIKLYGSQKNYLYCNEYKYLIDQSILQYVEQKG